MVKMLISIGGDMFKVDGAASVDQVTPYLSQWFDALALLQRIDNLSRLIPPASGTEPLRLTLDEDQGPSH